MPLVIPDTIGPDEGPEFARPLKKLRREGDLVVVPHGARWPDRCGVCNKRARGYRLRRELHWHHPLLYVLVVSPPLYIVLALLYRKKAVVEVGLCGQHQAARRRAIVHGWVIPLALVGSCVGGLKITPVGHGEVAVTILVASILGMFASLAVSLVRLAAVSPTRITARYAWIRCGRAFVESLPEVGERR